MYPTDPRQLNTERQIYLDKQFFVDVFSIPACVRNTALLQIVGGDKLIIPFC